MPRRFFRQRYLLLCILTGGILFFGTMQSVLGQGPWERGSRPYELDRAGRFTDDHIPLVDFEDLGGWTLEVNGGTASMSRSQEQMIWGSYTGRILYRGDTAGASFVLRPPGPIELPDSCTAVNMWVWNDFWMWRGDRGKPMVSMSLLLETTNGESFEIPFCRDLDWPDWYLLHIRPTSKQREAFANGGIFRGIRLSNCRINKEEYIFMDNLSFYQEDSTPLEYDVLPRPGVDLATGQDLGVHTGKERLPFPTREKTMLPDNISKNYTTELVREGKAYVFRYNGDDGTLEYRYKPRRGDLGDLTAQWMDGSSGPIRPMEGGGVQLKNNNEVEGLLEERFGSYLLTEPITHAPAKAELIECDISGETMVSRWKVSRGEQIAEVEYVFRLWQKSLVTDVHCSGGEVKLEI